MDSATGPFATQFGAVSRDQRDDGVHGHQPSNSVAVLDNRGREGEGGDTLHARRAARAIIT